jgi:predicted phosphodiesterase
LKYLIVSDIHGNWEALTAVLADAAGQYDAVLCCGDIVGYGADPNRVVDWVRANAQLAIRGNHDRACASLIGIDWFNPLAQAATRWTNSVLLEENRVWLEALPMGPAEVEYFQIVHGSPLDEDEYLLNVTEAAQAFAYSQAAIAFFGHTHIQCAFEHSRMRTWRVSPAELKRDTQLQDTSAYLINPGSVGQPRDGDPRAGYLLFDSTSRMLALRRVAYDIPTAQQKIVDAQLPPALAIRLTFGN